MSFLRRENSQNGSASIEATIALIFFIFAIWAIYALADFCILQAKMQYAISATAKEMSQYSYFYYKSGLKKTEANWKEQSQDALDAYDQLSQVIQGGKDVVTKAGSGPDKLVESVLSGEFSEYGETLNTAGSTILDIVDDPTKYLKSIAALAAGKLADEGKAHLASGLARGMTRRHFGDTPDKANEVLENLGVEGGYDALNFSASRIFMGDDKIQIVVCYRVDIKNIVPMFNSEIAICQTAVTNGWLGGDAGE